MVKWQILAKCYTEKEPQAQNTFRFYPKIHPKSLSSRVTRCEQPCASLCFSDKRKSSASPIHQWCTLLNMEFILPMFTKTFNWNSPARLLDERNPMESNNVFKTGIYLMIFNNIITSVNGVITKKVQDWWREFRRETSIVLSDQDDTYLFVTKFLDRDPELMYEHFRHLVCKKVKNRIIITV